MSPTHARQASRLHGGFTEVSQAQEFTPYDIIIIVLIINMK